MPQWLDIFNTIEKNKAVPFVDRIINKNKYPSLKDPKTGEDMTHMMSWGEVGGKYYVFPTIEMINGKLTNMIESGIDPFDYALKNKNYIEFDTPDMADYFSKNYKTYWDLTTRQLNADLQQGMRKSGFGVNFVKSAGRTGTFK